MKPGIAALVLAYVLSQFYRAFLAVLAPQLQNDIGVGPDVLGQASGVWFLVFAAMQVPVGWALDRIGPRRTAAVLFVLGGGGGALLFSAAQGPWEIYSAMALIGIGCSPVLMASYYIFARMYSPAIFGTLAGAILGAGSVGNILASSPLAWASEMFGWRGAMVALALITVAVGALLALVLRDPPHAETQDEGGSLLDLLKLPALWPILAIMFVNYAPAAGIRGLWAGPYFSQVHDLAPSGIGRATLVMGIAMIIGSFVYGPLDRILGTRKWAIFVGNGLGALCIAAFVLWPDMSPLKATFLFAAIGFFGSSFPLIVAHGRSYFPPHLTGRGVTLLNLFGIGGVGVMQMVTARTFEMGSTVTVQYQLVFATFLVVVVLGLIAYLFSRDTTN